MSHGKLGGQQCRSVRSICPWMGCHGIDSPAAQQFDVIMLLVTCSAEFILHNFLSNVHSDFPYIFTDIFIKLLCGTVFGHYSTLQQNYHHIVSFFSLVKLLLLISPVILEVKPKPHRLICQMVWVVLPTAIFIDCQQFRSISLLLALLQKVA